MSRLLKSLHHFLLPQDENLGYLPYVWLAYLGIYFFNFLFIPFDGFESHQIWLAILSVPAFLYFYFRAYWVSRSSLLLLLCVFAIWAIGALQAPVNPGASVFMVYAAALCSRFQQPKFGVLIIAAIILLIALQSWIFRLPIYFYLPAAFFAMLIGGITIYFEQIDQKNRKIELSEAQITKLAETAERERIARDLHDLIGHTFSMLTTKAQLAKKLFDHDLERCRKEIDDLENISRNALTQVREAVTGYRQRDLLTEIEQAKALLLAADIDCYPDIQLNSISPLINSSLGYVLRELVNNIVKHSNASRCDIMVQQNATSIRLDIRDNGNIETLAEGNGLSGIRERIAILKGKMQWQIENGLHVLLEVPNE